MRPRQASRSYSGRVSQTRSGHRLLPHSHRNGARRCLLEKSLRSSPIAESPPRSSESGVSEI
jgi:hypothetical protein